MTAEGFLLPGHDASADMSEETLSQAADDFGHIVTALPLGVLRPRSARQIQELIAFAGSRGLPVAVRGGGHSVYGQGQAAGGCVLDMSRMDSVLSVSDDRVVVEAGARWTDVVRATLHRGLTPLVLTGHLGSSVGGVLTTGGLGAASHRHGAVADCVLALDVVTGNGELVTCTPDHESGLYHAVLAGLGQCAVIVRATLRLAPAPERVRAYRLYHANLESYLADQRMLARDGRFDQLQGRARPTVGHGWEFVVEAAAHHTGSRPPDDSGLLDDLRHERDTEEIGNVSYTEFLHRAVAEERILRVTGEWLRPHPWLTLLLPDDCVSAFVPAVLRDEAQRDLWTRGLVLLCPLRAEALRSPLLRKPATGVIHLFALWRTAPPNDLAAVQQMVRANREVYERARTFGATVYPVSALPMSADDWRSHYGSAWGELASAKELHDPRRVLAPGPGVWR
ncbi:FAD-binding protein [Streptomyces sp. NPDC091280]|uniref:FAD-binding protein n=1 Tax=Streptomyces sp. NPDC091280 TaxID=3365984 RepID=UPI0038175373